MLLEMIQRLLRGEDRVLKDSRAQISAHKVNRQLIIYRYGGVQFWWDLDKGLRQFCMVTNAEVRAYNLILQELKDKHMFIKSGPIVFYKEGDKLWTSAAWQANSQHS